MRRLCLTAGCSSPATQRGRCALHAKHRDQDINRAGRHVYHTKRWRILRRRKLSETPLCERCGNVATDVHHKHGVETDAWSMAGLEALCKPCHSKETRREQLVGVGWPE